MDGSEPIVAACASLLTGIAAYIGGRKHERVLRSNGQPSQATVLRTCELHTDFENRIRSLSGDIIELRTTLDRYCKLLEQRFDQQEKLLIDLQSTLKDLAKGS